MTELQEKQFTWLDKMERKEVFSPMWKLVNYHVKCKTCNESVVVHTVGSVRDFIYTHENHYTWITHQGSEDVSKNHRYRG